MFCVRFDWEPLLCLPVHEENRYLVLVSSSKIACSCCVFASSTARWPQAQEREGTKAQPTQRQTKGKPSGNRMSGLGEGAEGAGGARIGTEHREEPPRRCASACSVRVLVRCECLFSAMWEQDEPVGEDAPVSISTRASSTGPEVGR